MRWWAPSLLLLLVPVVSCSPIAETDSDPNAPLLRELTSKDFYTAIKDGYWFVKHYSPQCVHCKHAAPHFQAVYKHYITSTPSLGPASSKHNPNSPSSSPSFEEAYNFHFAALDCIAFGDICSNAALKVSGYPTFNLYKNGELLSQFPNDFKVDTESLRNWLDDQLEEIKPSHAAAAAGAGTAAQAPPAHVPPVPLPPDYEPGYRATNPLKGKTNFLFPDTKRNPANPEGKSVALTGNTFHNLVTMTRDPWFIKFYAPWCTHCQSLAPAWSSLGREMKDKLNIGEVNCENERKLCKDLNLRGYPTMIFFQGGDRVEYEGLRGFGDLVSFAKKAAMAGIRDIDLAEYEELEKTEEVMFLYFYDFATTTEDFMALERLTLSLIGRAPLLKTDSENLAHKFKVTTFPRLVAIRDGRPFYYTALAPKDIRDHRKVLSWMKTLWLPIVPELTATNSHEIMNGKTVVLGILNRKKPEQWAQSKMELKKTALEYIEMRARGDTIERQELRDKKQMKIEEAEDKNDERALRAAKNIHVNLKSRKQVNFAWVDAIFWDRWVRQTYGVDVENDGERVIINDEDRKIYYDQRPDGGVIGISRSQILETLQAVLENRGSVQPKYTAGSIERWYVKYRRATRGHPILGFFLGLTALALIVVFARAKLRGKNGQWLVPKWSEKDGLLGGPNGGKYD